MLPSSAFELVLVARQVNFHTHFLSAPVVSSSLHDCFLVILFKRRICIEMLFGYQIKSHKV